MTAQVAAAGTGVNVGSSLLHLSLLRHFLDSVWIEYLSVAYLPCVS